MALSPTPTGAATAARLSALTALDERGARVHLGTLWADTPAVLGFVRHFG